MALVCSGRADATSVALAEAEARLSQARAGLARAVDRESATRAELGAVSAERDRLADELGSIISSTWWRMRRPFEPALRLRRRLRRRA
jgi:hypothetical protein